MNKDEWVEVADIFLDRQEEREREKQAVAQQRFDEAFDNFGWKDALWPFVPFAVIGGIILLVVLT